MLSPTELLIDRFVLIDLYPDSSEKVGYIYDPLEKVWNDKWFDEMIKYPNLFKKLGWWEKRSVDDMPGYVRNLFTDVMFKVEKHFCNFKYEDQPDHFKADAMIFTYSDFVPALESEYAD